MIDFLRGSFGKVIAFIAIFLIIVFTVKKMQKPKKRLAKTQEKQVAEKFTIKRDYSDYRGFKNKYLFRDPGTGKKVSLDEVLKDKDKPKKIYLDEDGNARSNEDIIKEGIKDGVITKNSETGELEVDEDQLKKFKNRKDAVSGGSKEAAAAKKKEEREKLLAELEGKVNNGSNQRDESPYKNTSDDDINDLKKELERLRRAKQDVKTDLLVRDKSRNKQRPKKEEYTISALSAFQYTAPAASKKLSDKYIPYGRMIKCVLRTAIDSSNQETPIVGLVLEDVYHDGKKIISAGAEVHGWAAKSPLRDRLSTQNNWIFVWRTRDEDNGKELKVKALALDYDYDPKTDTFGITDGSAGLKGEVINSDDYTQLKLYAMKFIQGVGEGYTSFITQKLQAQQTGDIVNSTVSTQPVTQQDEYKAILGEAASQVADLYIQNIVKEIEANGSYVRIPAGKTFYLYTIETVDKADASPGASSGKRNLEESKTGREKYISPESDLLFKSIEQLKKSRVQK